MVMKAMHPNKMAMPAMILDAGCGWLWMVMIMAMILRMMMLHQMMVEGAYEELIMLMKRHDNDENGNASDCIDGKDGIDDEQDGDSD